LKHYLTDAYADYLIENKYVKFYLQGTNDSVMVSYVSVDKDGNETVHDSKLRNLGVSNGQNVQCTKNGGVDIYPIPLQNVTSVLGIDSKGVTKNIIYNGVVTGTLDEITAFVMVIEMLINGKQSETKTYLTYDLNRVFDTNSVYPSDNPISIMFMSFTWSLQYGQTISLNYTLQLAEANPINADTSSAWDTIKDLLNSPLALFAIKATELQNGVIPYISLND